jgi:hypothetical protein
LRTKSKRTGWWYASRQNTRTLTKALLLGLFALNRHAKAQDVLAPSPPSPDQTPPALQQANVMDVFAASETPTEAQPFRWKNLTFRPHPFYQFLYADGIQVSTNNANGIQPSTNQVVNTTIQTISPGALLQIGRNWTLDYSPLFTIYSSKLLSDTFGQSARLAGGGVYNDWILGLIQGYSDTSSPSAETASQVRQQTYTTALNAAYTMNSKLSLDMGVNQNFVSADQFSSYEEWSTLEWLNYQFAPRLNGALGVGGGYDHEASSSNPDMTFEQFQGRVNWRATDKISFQLHGGVEVRQFLSGGVSPLVNPVFDASIQYLPFEHTKLTLTGQRTVSATYLQNLVTETTSVNAGLNQRLLGKLFLDLNGGYQMVKYTSSAASTSDRTDDLYSFNVRLSRAFLKRGNFAVLYQIGRNKSTLQGYSFTTHQVGFQIGYSY